jgi:endonuclease V-like protein UPF0215 family
LRDLEDVLRSNKRPRVVGFDDAPFHRRVGSPVPISGVVTSATRFEGMLYGRARVDGRDATEVIAGMLARSKFAPQVHAVLTDGLTMGGLNVIDLAALHEAAGVPCIAVMRRRPDLARFEATLHKKADGDERWAIVQRAGPIYEQGGFVFQCVGTAPEHAAGLLGRVTDRGKVPEPLRLAHLISSAVQLGESGRRA